VVRSLVGGADEGEQRSYAWLEQKITLTGD